MWDNKGRALSSVEKRNIFLLIERIGAGFHVIY